jgi:hypothetical protein
MPIKNAHLHCKFEDKHFAFEGWQVNNIQDSNLFRRIKLALEL